MNKSKGQIVKLVLILISFIFLFIPIWKMGSQIPGSENIEYTYVPLVVGLLGIKNFIPIPLFLPLLICLIIQFILQIKNLNLKAIMIFSYVNAVLYLLLAVILNSQLIYLIPLCLLLICAIFNTVSLINNKKSV